MAEWLRFNEEAEIHIIGCLLLRPECLHSFELSAEELYMPQTRLAYEAIVSLVHDRGGAVDGVTVADELQRCGHTQPTLTTLGEWAARVMTTTNVRYYAKIVRQYAAKRRLVEGAHKVVRVAEECDPADTYQAHEKGQATLASSYVVHSQSDSLGDAMDADGPEVPPAGVVVPTGLQALDRIIGGLPAGLVVLAARPSQGKSSLARIILRNVGQRGIPGAYVSLEETKREVVANMAITYGLVDSEHVTRGEMSRAEMERFAWAKRDLRPLPIYINADRPATGESICAWLRMKHSQRHIGLAVVDYWNRIQLDDRTPVREEANRMVTMFSALATKLEIPVVVVAQLNRDNDKEQRRPRMSDLKESGGWEEAARLVILCHREGFYKDSEPQDEIDLIIAKSKTTRTGRCRAAWCGKYLWVGDELPRDPDQHEQHHLPLDRRAAAAGDVGA